MGTKYLSNAGYFYPKFLVDGSADSELAKILQSNYDTIRIVNRMENHCPIVYVELDIDNEAFIKYNFYPQCNFQLEIWYADEDNVMYSQPMKLDLIILEMNVDLPQRYKYNLAEHHEVIHKKTLITCVPKRCHEILNATVNKMWWDPITIWGAVDEVVNELNLKNEKVKPNNCNSKLVKQLLAPPMSFQNFLLYMDEKYGIYNGKLFFYVHYTGNFHMWELKYIYDTEKPGIYTVHKMPSFTNEEKADYKKAAELARMTNNNYITYDEMQTICMSNDAFVKMGIQQYHIFHPQEDISRIKIWDAVSKSESNGIHSQKIDLKVNNPPLKKRITVQDGNIGDEKEQTQDISIMANYIDPAYKTNFLYFRIQRKFSPFFLMRIGEPMFLKTYADTEKKSNANYMGTYLILESDLKFTRDQGAGGGNDTVFAKCEVTCCRTSQSHN